jgi:hypothetical protein
MRYSRARDELRASLEGGQMALGSERSRLHRVLRVTKRAQHPVAVHVQLTDVFVRQPAEGLLVACQSSCELSPIVGSPQRRPVGRSDADRTRE